jgi:hypothetical protein
MKAATQPSRPGCYPQFCLYELREEIFLIEDMKPADWGVVTAAAVMALGAFCPIVSMPIVRSISGYRTKSAFIGAGSLVLMYTLVQFATKLSELQNEAAQNAKSVGAFCGLITTFSKSVGLEWGWFPLLGGAFGVVVIATSANSVSRSTAAGSRAVDRSTAWGS